MTIPPIRTIGPRIAASLKGLPMRDRVAAATGLSPETVGAVESFAMGATDPIKTLGRKGIEAWHGSPFRFDRFDPSRIGSGEGAQAFGRGFYAAEARPVAEGYRRTLPIKHMNRSARESYDWTDDPSDAMDALKAHPGMASDDYQTFLRELEKNDLLGFDYPHQAFRFTDHTNTYPDITPELMKARQDLGALYKLRLDVAPDELASLDVPVAQQPEIIRTAVSELLERLGVRQRGEGQSESLGEMLKRVRAGDNTLEDVLASRGVQGLRYLDGPSRRVGEGSENFVIFDPERIKILERLAAAGFSTEAIRTLMERVQSQPRDRQKTGGW